MAFFGVIEPPIGEVSGGVESLGYVPNTEETMMIPVIIYLGGDHEGLSQAVSMES